jgi:hypothetical protein
MDGAFGARLPGEADASAAPIRLRPLRGRDERWLTRLSPATPRERVVTRMLARRTRLGAADLRDLPVGDRDYLVLRLGQASFGDRVALTLSCPRDACGARLDLDFTIEDLPVHRSPGRSTFPVRDEHGDRVIAEFRLPTGADLEHPSVAGAADPAGALLERCLLGTGDRRMTTNDPRLRAAVETEMERAMPGVPREMAVTCPECGHDFSAAFDPVAWFVGRVRQYRALLDREVHLLSYHYHWPLDTILAMTGRVRREYVSILERELDLATS